MMGKKEGEPISLAQQARSDLAGRCWAPRSSWKSNGGWKDDVEEVDALLTPDVCTIEKRVACSACSDCSGCLSSSEFRDGYRNKKPVIITGLMDQWPARHLWQKNILVPAYAESTAPVDDAVVIVDPYHLGKKVPLSEAFAEIEDDPDLFMFDSQGVLQDNRDLLLDFSTPSFFKGFSPNHLNATSSSQFGRLENWHMITFGASGAGEQLIHIAITDSYLSLSTLGTQFPRAPISHARRDLAGSSFWWEALVCASSRKGHACTTWWALRQV
jgi:hypothetical protein